MAGGHKLAAPIADHVVRAIVEVKRRHAPEMVKLAMQMQHEFFELTGGEHRLTTGGLFAKMLTDDVPDGWLRDTLEFLSTGHGQWQTLLAGQATGAAMGGGIMAIVQNELASITQAALKADPGAILAPADAALAVSKGLGSVEWGRDQAARGGLPNGLFDVLTISNLQQLGPNDLTTLLNRGQIEIPELQRLLERAGYDPAIWAHVVELGANRLSAEQLATLVTFGVLPQDKAADMAGESGTSASDFNLLVEGNGEPPSNEELLFAYRRGLIDKARLLKGITQGPVRNEWFDVLESLGIVPMSTADAIACVVQGNLTDAQGQSIAKQNGLDPADWAPLVATAGSPPGPEFLMTAYQRGFLTENEAEQGIREGRTKNKYIPLYTKMARTQLTEVQIRAAVTHGAITEAQAIPLLLAHGLSPEDAHTILASVSAVKTATVRQFTVSQILALYTDRSITAGVATGYMEALGWSLAETQLLLDEGDLRRLRSLIDAAVSVVKSKYVGRHIDQATADTDLDALGIQPAQKTDLFTYWNMERDANVKQLTLAQLTSALKKDIIDEAAYRTRISGMGYVSGDVDILVGLATAGTPTAGG